MLLAACQPQAQDAGQMAAASVSESELSWESLFDGASLDKWRGYKMEGIPGGWSVQDSVIYCAGTSGGDIITKSQWQDFELQLEWKISDGGNSGIYYRLTELHHSAYDTGPEYQLLDNTVLAGVADRLDETTASVFDVYSPSVDLTKPVGEWNSTRIVADSTHVEHWLNGTRVVQFDLFTADWDKRIAESKWTEHMDFGRMKSGHIGFQDHGNEVWFRNIKIRKLPDTVQ
jgi:hypothetical protein